MQHQAYVQIMYFYLPNHCSCTSQTIVKSCISCVSCIFNKSLGIWYNCWKKQQKTAKCKSSPPSTRGALAAPPCAPPCTNLSSPAPQACFLIKNSDFFCPFYFLKTHFLQREMQNYKKKLFRAFCRAPIFFRLFAAPFPC